MTEDLRTAIIVNRDLPLGLIANTVGAIAIRLGAKVPDLAARQMFDKQSRMIDISSRVPVPILQADDELLRDLLLKSLDHANRSVVVPFPSFARSLHDYIDYERCLPTRDLAEEAIDGIGLAGPAKWVIVYDRWY